MGIHGNSTCVMNYDERDRLPDRRGEPRHQRHVHDDERGAARRRRAGARLSEVAYQNAAAYAKDRLQGRALGGAKFPDKPADPIIVHPDVRRMLMTMRAFNEAARAL